MNLRDWRKLKGWRQEDLADKIGESRATYQAWEGGRNAFPPAIKLKIQKLGFTGEFPDPSAALTQGDLQALGRDLVKQVNYSHEDLKRDIQALGAAVQELLKRSEGKR